MKQSLKTAALFGGMILSWSIYYAASKVLVGETGSPLLAGFLLRLAALLFLTAQLVLDGSFSRLFHQGKAVKILLMIGVFGFLLDLFANLGYAGGSLSTGTALLKTDVLMVNLVTVILYKKRLYLSDWLGTAVMLLGVLLVLGVDFGSMTIHATDLFFLLSAACVTANAFIIKRAQEKYHEDADMISYYNNFVVLLLFGLSSGLAGDMGTLSQLPLKSLWWLILLGGLAQTGIYFFYYRNLKSHEVWEVKLALLLMPVVSCFIGVLCLQEELTARKLLGIAVVLLGAALLLLRGRTYGRSAEKGRANEGDDRFCAVLFRPSITEKPGIQQVFPVFFYISSGRKMPRAKLHSTANREIFVSGEAHGAGILDMYSEHRQQCLARKDPVCGCRIPNLHALMRVFRFF